MLWEYHFSLLQVSLSLFVDEERIGQKRRKKINHFNNFFGDGTGGAGGASGGGGGGYFKGNVSMLARKRE